MREVTADHLSQLEASAGSLLELLESQRRQEQIRELILQFRQPGWTTPAEFRLVMLGITQITEMTRLADQLGESLLAGAREVSLG